MKNTTQRAIRFNPSLVWCADDFGLHAAIDEAVLDLAASGRLQATSCLVNGPSFAAHAQALRHSGLQVGLHLNFTEPLPHTPVCASLSVLMRQSWLRQLSAASVAQQIQQQWNRFVDVMGYPPHFVDGHQHVHQFPVIRDQLFDVMQGACVSTPLPWLRSTHPGSLRGLPVSQQFKAYLIAALGASSLSTMASLHGYATNRQFFGVYDFKGGAAVYAAYVRAWQEQAQPGDLIMCHPARRAVPTDPLAQQRVAEYSVLMQQGCH